MKSTNPVVGATVLALLSLSSPLFADAPAYKADLSFGNEDMKNSPVCVAIDAKDQLYVLLDDGAVLCYDPAGKKTGGFKATMTPAPTTMTLADGKIYLFNTLREAKEVTFQGKKIKRLVAAGVGCAIYDPAGTKVSEMKLAEAASATDAHFIGKELAIGDFEKGQIVFFDTSATPAKMTRKITKVFRLCCGIFDFCPGTEPDSLIAANLGAFKVQSFKGIEKTGEFGQRGEKPEEFRGCCNPVNLATLADGSLVTVEKDPTRVKIFDKDRKTCTKVTGLTELVQGCSTIPIAVDSKGALYLASDTKKCIVKCVPGVSDKPEPPEPKEEAMPDLPEQSAAMKEIIEKVMPLMQEKDYAKAMTEAEAVMKAHPEMGEEEKVQILLGIGLAPHMEKGDEAAALAMVDSVLKAHPTSELAKHADEVKESIKQSIVQMKEMQEETAEGEAMPEEDAADKPADTPKEEPAADPKKESK